MNHSTSDDDSEELSAATIRHYPSSQNQIDPSAMPDLLNSSSSRSRKTGSSGEKERPRSCIESGGVLNKPNFKLGDVTSVAKKRWSGISLNSKLYLVYDRLAKEDDEEYTDSLENTKHNTNSNKDATLDDNSKSDENMPSLQEDDGPPESLDSNLSDEKPLNGRRFKKLQQKWEMLSGRESSQSPPLSPTTLTTPTKSKIPRPITSPVRPSGIPVPVKKILTPPGAGKVALKLTSHNVKYATQPTTIIKKATPNSRLDPQRKNCVCML